MKREIILGKIKNILDSVNIIDGEHSFLDTYKFIMKLHHELSKDKNFKLFEVDLVIMILSDIVKFTHLMTSDLKQNKKLAVILGNDLTNKMAEEIYRNISSLPKEYYVFFKIPNLPLSVYSQREVTKEIKLVNIYPNNFITSEDEIEKIQPGQYIRITARGYLTSFTDSQTFSEGCSLLKRFLYLALSSRTFKINSKPVPPFKKDGVAYCCLKNGDEVKSIDLPDEISKILSSLVLEDEVIKSLEEYDRMYAMNPERDDLRPETTPNVIPKEFISYLSETHLEKYSSINNGLIWAYDSLVQNNNPSLKVIHLSIALETLLGSENRNSVTERLADRCSYLISRSSEERKDVYEKFIKFYDLRSSIIHGSSAHLSKEKIQLIVWAESVLRSIFFKEIRITNKSKAKDL